MAGHFPSSQSPGFDPGEARDSLFSQSKHSLPQATVIGSRMGTGPEQANEESPWSSATFTETPRGDTI